MSGSRSWATAAREKEADALTLALSKAGVDADWLVLLATALVAGVLIGGAGVGGVVLAPALILVGGLEPHQATATTLCCLVPTGLAGAVHHRTTALRRRSLERTLAPGLLVGAITGALLARAVSATVLTGILAGVAGAGGVWLLARTALTGIRAHRRSLNRAAGTALGAAAGVGSVISGTSGPVLLVPALTAARLPTDRAVAVSQAAQAIVAPAGAVTYLWTVDLDYLLLPALSVMVLLGYVVGQRTSSRLRGTRQNALVALVLLGTAVLLLTRSLYV